MNGIEDIQPGSLDDVRQIENDPMISAASSRRSSIASVSDLGRQPTVPPAGHRPMRFVQTGGGLRSRRHPYPEIYHRFPRPPTPIFDIILVIGFGSILWLTVMLILFDSFREWFHKHFSKGQRVIFLAIPWSVIAISISVKLYRSFTYEVHQSL